MENYDPKTIEKKWQRTWEDLNLYKADDFSDEEKKYILIEFPYPSGAGLHVGHVRSYTALDVFSRKLRMQGKNVLYPIGWDAFGLPTENYAIKNKIHPRIATEQNICTFIRQIKSLGISFDWSREIDTTDPAYYKWTQWIFLKLYEHGMAYKANIPINWCPACKIGLANEEVADGKCERCGVPVEQRNKEQWMLAITKYADRLIDDLETVDYLEKIKTQQINWIGRSEGASLKFKVNLPAQAGSLKDDDILEVFTTRPDTLFGCTYMVVCPEHSLISNFKFQISNFKEVERYIKQSKNKSDLERTENKEKTGVKLEGLMAINPANNKEIPIFVADYVLSGYGTGAIMAVPAHDERDFEFAKKYGVVIKEVVALLIDNTKTPSKEEAFGVREDSCPRREIWNCHLDYSIEDNKNNVKSKNGAEPAEGLEPSDIGMTIPDPHHAAGTNTPNLLYQKNKDSEILNNRCFAGEGISVNSEFLNGLKTKEAKEKMFEWLEEKKFGERKKQYHLRDWVFSRQHYWGEPIPIVHCAKCGIVPLPEDQLPLTLPDVKNYEPTDTGESPLANISEWVNTTCPKCGGEAKRETDTMPNWAGSSWYFLRYIDPKNDNALADTKKLKYWMPVDLYNGGMEHTTLHLLYSRFWNKFLYDIGVVPFSEPYARRVSHGMIQAEDGKKMSKSLGNVINPDDVVKEFGADTLRVYEMFMGPYAEAIPWNTDGLKGVRRFLEKVWGIGDRIMNHESGIKNESETKLGIYTPNPSQEENIKSLLHKTIKKVTEDIDNFKFNTAISAMMILVNEMEKTQNIGVEDYKLLLLILSPFAPHICEELWGQIVKSKKACPELAEGSKVKSNGSIFIEKWPIYDPELAKDETVDLIIQINGKMRDKVEVSSNISEDETKNLALAREKVQEWTKGKKIMKVVFVKGRLVNVVVK